MSEMVDINEIYLKLVRLLTANGLIQECSQSFGQLLDNRARLEFAYELLEKYDLLPDFGTTICGKSNEKCENLLRQGMENENKSYIALDILTKAIANGLTNSENLGKAYIERSKVLFKLGIFPECIEDLQRAIKCDNINAAHITPRILEYQAAAAGETEKLVEQLIPKISHKLNTRIACAGDSIMINNSSNSGRCVMATKDIQAGDVIAVEKPYTAIVLPEPNISTRHCHQCLKMSYGLMPCEHCTYAFFCSPQCQDLAWKNFHRYECPVMSTFIDSELNKLKLMAIRVAIVTRPKYEEILTYTMETFLREEKYESGRYKEIHGLCANTALRTVADMFVRSVNAALIYDIINRKTDFFQMNLDATTTEKHKAVFKELLLRHLQTSPSNFHEITERRISIDTDNNDGTHKALSEEIGGGAYSFLSMLNHSCSPNVFRQSYGTSIVLRALSPIKKGEELFDNYGYHYAVMSKSERQEQLKLQYLFECQCQPCVDDWPTYNSLEVIRGQPDISLQEIDIISRHSYNHELLREVLNELLKKAQLLEKLKPCKNLADVQECIKECYNLLAIPIRKRAD